MSKKLWILAIVAVLLFISFKFFDRPCDCAVKTEVRIGEVVVMAELADTPEERVQGLSGRDELKEGEGMLFVFDKPGKLGIWMKEMNFSIDIIWIDADMRVIGVEEGVSPDTYPETFEPPSDIKYVLEVPSGFSSRHGIESGLILSIGQ